MYRIAICDDEINTCAVLEEMLHVILKSLNIKAEIEPWYSGESLCLNLDEGNRYDLIFLDIGLIKIDGISVGKYIRNSLEDLKTYIIYISHNQGYAIQLFKIQPLDFLVKPLTYNAVNEAFRIFLRIAERKNIFLEYSIENCYYKQPYDNIIYIRSDNKKIQLILFEEEIEFYNKLNIIYKDLSSDFLQIHQSYIINKDYVMEYSYEKVRMINEDILSISRPYRNMVRNHLLGDKKDE